MTSISSTSLDDIVRERANGGDDTVIVLSTSLVITSIANVEHIIYVDQSMLQPSSDDASVGRRHQRDGQRPSRK